MLRQRGVLFSPARMRKGSKILNFNLLRGRKIFYHKPKEQQLNLIIRRDTKNCAEIPCMATSRQRLSLRCVNSPGPGCSKAD